MIRVAGVALNQTALDWRGNEARLKKALQEVRTLGVQIVCFPELCIPSYGCEDAFLAQATSESSWQVLMNLLPETKGMICVFGLPHFHHGSMYNCAVVVQDQKILGISPKRCLAREGIHYEPRWFRPWEFGRLESTLTPSGLEIPIGDAVYEFGRMRLGIEICEEAWGPSPAATSVAEHVEIIVNPSASHFSLGKYATREHLIANSSRALGVHYIYTNLMGVDAGRSIYDGGVLVSSLGRVVGRGKRFSFQDIDVTACDVDVDLARTHKAAVRSETAPPKKIFMPLVVAGTAVAISKKNTAPLPPVSRALWNSGAEEEFLAAECLGLFDYLRKSKAKGFTLPLSGGCDSSTCAVLIAQMVALGVCELSIEGFAQKVGLPAKKKKVTAGELIPAVLRALTKDEKKAVQEFTGELLSCIYLSTKQSGAATRTSAAKLAQALGASYTEMSVQETVDQYVKMAEGALEQRLTWEKNDLALQNIQARARAPVAWLMANVKSHVLITTCNRSEAAVGYATVDGDTAGGLAPLTGIDKHFLRQWLRWAESDCEIGIGPCAALRYSNDLEPTAELRPAKDKQTDEKDLMPYDVLAILEESLGRDRMDPSSALTSLLRQRPQLKRKEAVGYVQKFLKMFALSQWKRERMAPSFHVDRFNFDAKSWCRFPILNGGFAEEIEKLQ